MSKLQAALAWARRGFRVFPLMPDSKLPLDLAWTLHATTDESVIRGWWIDPVLGCERDWNIGFLTTGWVVPDVDVKDDKPGLETMSRLGLVFDTLTMRTPTGGYHLVYKGLAHPVGGSPLGVGVDVRSHNGYVVAPGSTIGGVPYEVELDLPVAEFPEHLRHLLKVPRRRADIVPADVELDAPETVELVAHWLLHDAQPAIEGENGDDTTYRVCCRMRDFGVSESQALDLFLDEYNPRCSPEWSVEEARLKIENAYRYATGGAGTLSPAAAFGHVVPVPLPEPNAAALMGALPQPTGDFPSFGNMLDEQDIPPRAWVLHGLLGSEWVTMLVAPGGVGKSLFSLIMAAHLAVGRDFMGYKVIKPGKSIIYNAEDDRKEVSRRLNAVIALYGLDYETVKSRISIWGSDDIDLQVTRSYPPVADQVLIERLVERCTDPELVLFSIDPLVEVHTGHENDAVDMRFVMGIFRSLARRCSIPVMIVQHTGKTNPQSSYAGNQDAGRGSSAMPAAARIMLTLEAAKESDCITIGAPSADVSSYVRLDGAKATALSAKERTNTRWMRWESHRLSNGDGVGVLVEHDAATASKALAAKIASVLSARLLEDGHGGTTLDEAAALAASHGFKVSKPDLAQMFAQPVYWGDTHHVVHKIEMEGSRKTSRLVMR